MDQYTVDRIESGIAVLLLRSDESLQKEVPVFLLPSGIKEGDIIEVNFNGDKIVVGAYFNEETENARKKAQDLLQKILDKNR